MWIVNVNGKWYKTENLETISKNLKASLKPLKKYVELEPRLLNSIVTLFNSETDTAQINYNFHQLKIKKNGNGVSLFVYLKIPSAKKKMVIDKLDLNLLVLNTENLETI